MPKLLVLAACEKLIIDNHNVVSLISLLQEVNVNVPPEVDIPADQKLVPMNWTILSIWQRLPHEEEKSFEQRTAMLSSSGEEIFAKENEVNFRPEPPATRIPTQHRTVGMAQAMPLAEGDYLVKVWLREKGSTDWGAERGAYPITLNRVVAS